MSEKFDWKKVPTNQQGFVEYDHIPSPPIRRMVAEAERIKVSEEYKARIQWNRSGSNQARLMALEVRLQLIDQILYCLKEVDS